MKRIIICVSLFLGILLCGCHDGNTEQVKPSDVPIKENEPKEEVSVTSAPEIFETLSPTPIVVEVTETPIPTEIPEEENWEKEQEDSIGIENNKIVIRYETTEDIFRDSENLSEWVDTLVPFVDVLPESNFVYLEEEMILEVYDAGTVFVPYDIEYDELKIIINTLCYASLLRYQDVHPETDSDYGLLIPRAEMDMSMLNLSDYTNFAYKALADAYVWEDGTLSNQIYSDKFGIYLDIIFYLQ